MSEEEIFDILMNTNSYETTGKYENNVFNQAINEILAKYHILKLDIEELEKIYEKNIKSNARREKIFLEQIAELEKENKEQQKEIEELKEVNKLFIRKRHHKNHTLTMRKTFTTNKTGYPGVCAYHKGNKRYRAYIVFRGKQYHLGLYDTIEEAAKARKKGEEYIEELKNNLVDEV